MRYALKLSQSYAINHSPIPVRVSAMDDFEPDNLKKCPYVVFVVSTYTEGEPPANAKMFTQWLEDTVNDFRVERGSLSGIKFTVFGLGSSDYKNHFNAMGKKMKKLMIELGAKSLCRCGAADFSDSIDTELTPDGMFERWALKTLLPSVQKSHEVYKQAELNRVGMEEQAKVRAEFAAAIEENRPVPDEVEADEWDEESDNGDDDDDDDGEDDDEDDEDDDDEVDVGPDGEDVVDLEDLGNAMDASKADKPKVIKVKKSKKTDAPKKPRKMLSERQRANLTKQGYKIIGSHSGVKLCRWTKAMLRGRGGCYKHTFYGITSYQCMEMTPSLACANKCVFCWRHHTNPVGTEWRWETDRPELVLQGGLDNHRKMIAEMKGVPGVQPSRFQEALKPRHCALSLVGEPIMYPYINEFMNLLHSEEISSFLVTNAQFPEQMKTLVPVTQLYLSIDGHSPEALKKVDRPLHLDFWERFVASMHLLKEKKQRTVYRLTLVKGFNMEEVAEYARLVSVGNPTFIEIKGVTYCGAEGGLGMKNVPFHEEVRAWCQALCSHLDGQYELACEHQHSCCILISDKKMKAADGTWNTWIDYPKFLQLFNRWKATGEDFTDLDYSAPTPAWAVFGAQEAGFSPNEIRVKAKGKGRDTFDADGMKMASTVVDAGCCKGGDDNDNSASGCCKSDDSPKNDTGCCQKDDSTTTTSCKSETTEEQKSSSCCKGSSNDDGCCKKE